MRVTSFNIQFGRGRDGRFDLDRTIDAIRDADVIALQEVEVGWDRSGNRSQAVDIAAALSGHFSAFHATVDLFKGAHAPDGRVVDRRRQFGNMILSRWPIRSVRRFDLPRFTAFAQHTIQRGVIEGVIDAPSGAFRFYSTHLCHLSESCRVAQVARIRAIHREAPADGAPSFGPHRDPIWNAEPSMPAAPADAIICGDMNFLPESPAHLAMVGERHRGSAARLTPLDGFVDAWERNGTPEDPGHTLYTDAAAGAGIRIDYVFVSTSMAHRLRSIRVDRDCIASDHQPVHCEFSVA